MTLHAMIVRTSYLTTFEFPADLVDLLFNFVRLTKQYILIFPMIWQPLILH